MTPLCRQRWSRSWSRRFIRQTNRLPSICIQEPNTGSSTTTVRSTMLPPLPWHGSEPSPFWEPSCDGIITHKGAHMDDLWRTMLWKQFGATIDMLDNAILACPDALWRQPVWRDPSAPSQRTEFWYVAYHALFWLDLYLFGAEEGFAPPPPLTLIEQDDAVGPLPDRIFSRNELHAYLASVRQKCRTIIETMTGERARQPVNFPWIREGEI